MAKTSAILRDMKAVFDIEIEGGEFLFFLVESIMNAPEEISHFKGVATGKHVETDLRDSPDQIFSPDQLIKQSDVICELTGGRRSVLAKCFKTIAVVCEGVSFGNCFKQ